MDIPRTGTCCRLILCACEQSGRLWWPAAGRVLTVKGLHWCGGAGGGSLSGDLRLQVALPAPRHAAGWSLSHVCIIWAPCVPRRWWADNRAAAVADRLQALKRLLRDATLIAAAEAAVQVLPQVSSHQAMREGGRTTTSG